MATTEDKEWGLDTWARFFAAKTWKDIKMIAKNNEILTSATESLFKLNADDLVRERCRAREEAERHERTVQKKITEQAETIKELKAINDELTSKYDKLQSDYDELQSNYKELQSGHDELKSIVTSLQKSLPDKTD